MQSREFFILDPIVLYNKLNIFLSAATLTKVEPNLIDHTVGFHLGILDIP